MFFNLSNNRIYLIGGLALATLAGVAAVANGGSSLATVTCKCTERALTILEQMGGFALRIDFQALCTQACEKIGEEFVSFEVQASQMGGGMMRIAI